MSLGKELAAINERHTNALSKAFDKFNADQRRIEQDIPDPNLRLGAYAKAKQIYDTRIAQANFIRGKAIVVSRKKFGLEDELYEEVDRKKRDKFRDVKRKEARKEKNKQGNSDGD